MYLKILISLHSLVDLLVVQTEFWLQRVLNKFNSSLFIYHVLQ